MAKNSTRIMYHVSPSENHQSITQKGIDPFYSTGKMRVSWYVHKKAILWAIAHVSMKYDIPVSKINVYVVEVNTDNLVRFFNKGLYHTNMTYQYEGYSTADYYAKTERMEE